MHHIKEFSRFAKSYGKYNVIQREVAKELSTLITDQPRCMIDLGCGSGTFYDTLGWPVDKYVAIDLSDKMLELHPKADNIEFVHANFDDPALFKKLKTKGCDRLVSSSSLQWSQDLASLFWQIKDLKIPFSLALFTSGTFKTLHKTAGIDSPLLSSEVIAALADDILHISTSLKHYTLRFDSKRELFNYIKKSGVSGTKRELSYRATKLLMQEYPLDYLEFEVIYLTV